jgi:hypothetical protein
LYASAAACLTSAVDAARSLPSSSVSASSSAHSSSLLRNLNPHVTVALLMSMAQLSVVTGPAFQSFSFLSIHLLLYLFAASAVLLLFFNHFQ